MKVLPINRYRFYQSLQPLFLLKKITSKSTNGCLQVFTASASWLFYVQEGKLIYACCTEKMFEIIYKHLQYLSQKIPTLHHGIKERLQAIFETGIENQAIPNPDYLAICWLVKHKYITSPQAGILIEQLALEVLESFLSLKEGSYEFTSYSFLDEMPKYCHLDIRLLVECCQKRSQQRLEGRSSQSRLFSANTKSARVSARSPHLEKNKSSVSFQQHPVANPAQSQSALPKQSTKTDKQNSQSIRQTPTDKKLYNVLCIDDSPIVVNAITRFLDRQVFSVVGINEPLKALVQIIRVKPDIILLDIEMPNLDGYELCSLVRNHSLFQETPIIMITGRTSFIDKARAKIVGASGVLNKPFSQADLIKILFQYLD
ncbi:response regulator [Chlorogloeopsis fritschii PCC 9212]|uniref:Protein PatA n=1 Tax=Chlorogloeopsis fritschii PCC 6912 TaxID=211165 RepID=A0A3S1A1E9_CHLFR|nr:response regulator [Chlorogloeopsis fritschii]RUR83371.1 two-component system response regulator [Chlorogloeopsis fritschii PCC 6912]